MFFSIEDFQALEKETLDLLGLEKTQTLFQEEVGVYLFEQWKLNRQDDRFVKYCFPLLDALINKNYTIIQALRRNGIYPSDVFQELVSNLLSILPSLDPSRGKLGKYLWFVLRGNRKGLLAIAKKNSKNGLTLEDPEDEEIAEEDVEYFPIDEESREKLREIMKAKKINMRHLEKIKYLTQTQLDLLEEL